MPEWLIWIPTGLFVAAFWWGCYCYVQWGRAEQGRRVANDGWADAIEQWIKSESAAAKLRAPGAGEGRAP